MKDILMQQYPDTINTNDFELQGIYSGLCILLSFILPAVNTVLLIAKEKEMHLKEMMKIHGISTSMHWIGWFLRNMILILVTISIIVGMMKVKLLLQKFLIFNFIFFQYLFFRYHFTQILLCYGYFSLYIAFHRRHFVL